MAPLESIDLFAGIGGIRLGSVGNVGVSRPSEVLPKAARADGNSRGDRPSPNLESRRAFYAASTLSASARLASITRLAMRASSASGLGGADGPFSRFSS